MLGGHIGCVNSEVCNFQHITAEGWPHQSAAVAVTDDQCPDHWHPGGLQEASLRLLSHLNGSSGQLDDTALDGGLKA